jgi:uncharacterized protein
MKRCIFLILLFTFTFPLYAQDAAEQYGIDADLSKNYYPYPSPGAGYVTDLGDFLSEEEEDAIEMKLWRTEKVSGVEIAVVTIPQMKDFMGTPETIEAFAHGLFDKYGIGNLPKNDGVLLLVSRSDREARIHLGKHYGHQRDGDATKIMNNVIVPAFKKGEYTAGINSGIDAIMEEFANIHVRFHWEIVVFPLLALFFAVLSFSLFKSGKSGWAWVALAAFFGFLFLFLRAVNRVAEQLPDSDSDNWSSGGSGGGFGGGSSGGGGATGKW